MRRGVARRQVLGVLIVRTRGHKRAGWLAAQLRESGVADTMDDAKNNLPSFIGKLALMLKDKSATPFVTWSQAGDSIVVIDPPTFATQVLPR